MKRIKDHRYLYRRGDTLHFRRNIPPYARDFFEGRNEVWVSLGTANVAEARHVLIREIEKFERRLAQATRKIAPADVALSSLRSLDKAEIEEAVREWLAGRVERIHVDFPVEGSDLARRESELGVFIASVRAAISGRAEPPLDTIWAAEEIANRKKWRIEAEAFEYRYLIRLVGRGQIEAAERQLREIQGVPHKVLDDTFSPEQYVADEERRKRRAKNEAVSLHLLFAGYAAEQKPSPATIKSWKRLLKAFTDFLGHDDASRVSTEDVVRWKEHLLSREERPLSPKTVGDTYLSVIKTTYRWAIENHKLASNPANVRVRKPRKMVVREPGFNDDEAYKILSATLSPVPPRLIPERVLARRWIPWLCAYTGARINELTQLRREDVAEISGVWSIRITPEAGSVKDGRARVIAIHPHIIEQGFLSAIEGKAGHLFIDLGRKRGGSIENPQTHKVGQFLADWVRSLGIKDVQPNHGWRHRFATVARNCRLDEEVRHYILGHAYPTQAKNYGSIMPGTTLKELLLMPRIEVAGT